MSRPSAPGSKLATVLAIIGLAALALVTLADRAATRLYSWPWSCLRGLPGIAAVLILLLRAFHNGDPLRLPSRPWWVTAIAGSLVLGASALLSPFRDQSLLWASAPLSALAVYLVAFDWIQADPAARSRSLEQALAVVAVIVAAESLGLWLGDVLSLRADERTLRVLAEMRNPHPLGHSNYTAGLSLLLLPWPFIAARQRPGFSRWAWTMAGAGMIFVLLTSGSRGGLLGAAAGCCAALWFYQLPWKRILAYGLVALVAVGAVALANPRIRSLGLGTDLSAAPDESHVQRAAMIRVGESMGHDRPVLGWGPGTTPLVYPRYRALADGGVEDALQLHSTPVELWAEEGALGLAVAAIALGLVVRCGRRAPAAATALCAYAVFCLTDWQGDIPVFAVGCALLAALVSEEGTAVRKWGLLTAGLAACLAALAGFLGAGDPAAVLNVRALGVAAKPGEEAQAIRLLRESLAINPDQEIAHFNLGWLLVASDPAEAETHFREASRLVPDKGGVYFGLGLSAINRGNPSLAVRALALECLNDPSFITSAWWRVPQLARLRPAALARLGSLQERLELELPPGRWPAQEVPYLIVLDGWFTHQASAAAVAAVATTAPRREFFLGNPATPDLTRGPVISYHRERTGYPVVARNLDLPPPQDVYLVQDSREWTLEHPGLFPAKGWIPTPALVSLAKSELTGRR